jgi:uncharacterized protein (TIGR03083 family)
VNDVAPLTPDDLRAAAGLVVAALRPLARDPSADAWDAPAGSLEWSCRRTLDHVNDVLFLQAGVVARRATGPIPVPRNGDPAASPAELLETLRTSSAVLARLLVHMADGERAFHPAGMADRSGWLAMACDEVLVHGADVAAGLGVAFTVPGELAGAVLARLFPWTPAEGDAWRRLRWANGRADLPSTPNPGSDWWWHPAPLEEWAGGGVRRRTSPPRWT